MIKIDIISGFLGAGKTTLIKKLIKDELHKEKVVLIENEFGEIGIDGGFLQDAGIEIREMNSGCICCSLVGDFRESLIKVIDEYEPERIIIEPSGVGKLSDVIAAVKDVAVEKHAKMNSFTTVADAMKCNMYMKNFGEFFNNQIENANTIVLSRTQKLNEDKLHAVVHAIKHHNADATIITTPWDQLDGKDILEAMEQSDILEKEMLEESGVCDVCGHQHHHDEHEHCHHEHHHEHEHCHHEHHDEHECCCGHDHHHHHHADDVFTSMGMETVNKFSEEELKDILEQLSNKDKFGTILRAKGMLESIDGEWLYFDMVPEECEIRKGKPTYTGRFCVIGSSMNEDAIKEAFHIA